VDLNKITLTILSSKTIFFTNEIVEFKLSTNLEIYENLNFVLWSPKKSFTHRVYYSEDNLIFTINFDDYLLPDEYCIRFALNENEFITNCDNKITILNPPTLKDVIITDTMGSNLRTFKFLFDSNLINIQDKCIVKYIFETKSAIMNIDIVTTFLI
jgi:hypothetical protein